MLGKQAQGAGARHGQARRQAGAGRARGRRAAVALGPAGCRGAQALGRAGVRARGRASGRAAGRADARLGARCARGTAGRQHGRAACARGLGQLGQVGVLCTLTWVFWPGSTRCFPSHQMNTIHCEIKFFEKKIILKIKKIFKNQIKSNKF